MKIIQRIYLIGIMTILIGIVFHAPLSVGLGVLFPAQQEFIKSWKEIIMVVLAVLAIVAVSKRKLWHEFGRDWVFRCITAYALLHIVTTTFLWQGLGATAAGFAIDLRYLLFFGLTYTFIKLWPQYKKPALIASIAGAVVVVVFGLLQIFVLPRDVLSLIGYSKDTIAPYLTVDKNPDYIRINSLLRGPNPLGAYMVGILALIAAFVVRSKNIRRNGRALTALAVFALGAIAVLWASYSRSAAIGAVVAVGIVVAVTVARKMSRQAWIVASVVLFAVIGSLIVGRDSSFVSNVILHENPVGGSSISSNEGHVSSLENSTTQMLHQPFGAGVGSTGSASLYGDKGTIIENQYLFVAHETGWLGLGLFLAILSLILKRLWHRRTEWLSLGLFASGVGLFLIGMLLPVWVDDTVSIVWWGLAGIALGGLYGKQKSN